MIKNISVDSLFQLPDHIPVIDVRTPREFDHGHIPGALNIPLFSNEERVLVGTTYKKVGREEAILLGFDLTGAKWSGFIKTALQMAPGKQVAVHCWRGGMRSGAMAWALNMYGFDVYLLEGGYKRFRRWALLQFEQPYNLMVLGGMTGSGKTRVLHQLKNQGEQVIDLEYLAQHQGSSYGSMNQLVQPTQEQFENDFALGLFKAGPEKRLWIEDESIIIGKRSIPNSFWRQMREADVVQLIIPAAERIQFLVKEYGRLDKTFLVECTQRIWKRLGPEQTRDAIAAIHENKMADFIRIALVYYDKTYSAGLKKRDKCKVHDFSPDAFDPESIARQILTFVTTPGAGQVALSHH